MLLAEDRERKALLYGANTKNLELKHAVAKRAAELIEDKDSLVVTCGMTPHLTLRYADTDFKFCPCVIPGQGNLPERYRGGTEHKKCVCFHAFEENGGTGFYPQGKGFL